MKKSLVVAWWCVLAALAGCDGNGNGTPDGGNEDSGTGTDSGTPSDGGSSCTVTPAATWAAPNFETNAATALALRTQLDALVGAPTMRGAEDGTATVDELTDLTEPFGAGDPSVQSVTTAFYAGIMEDVFDEFLEITAAGGQDLVDDSGAWAPGANGGIFGTSFRGINEGGLEVRQLADKGLFGGGALYSYALTLTEGEITQATVESLGALWGTNQALDFETRTDSANYSYAMGYHGPIVEALVAAHAYAADDACTTERDAALVTFFRAWEQSLFARFVYYANAGAADLGTAAGDDEIVAGGLHELGEGVGLALGFRGVSSPASGPLAGAGRVSTDAAIDAMMEALGVNTEDLGASTTGTFVSDPGSFEDAVLEVETLVQSAFDLTPAQVQAWRAPTPG